jgi:hypothetical protein
MKNFMCRVCEDTGKVGLVFKKICPQCEGNPEAYFLKTFKAPSSLPPPPPPGRAADIVIEIRKRV